MIEKETLNLWIDKNPFKIWFGKKFEPIIPISFNFKINDSLLTFWDVIDLQFSLNVIKRLVIEIWNGPRAMTPEVKLNEILTYLYIAIKN